MAQGQITKKGMKNYFIAVADIYECACLRNAKSGLIFYIETKIKCNIKHYFTNNEGNCH